MTPIHSGYSMINGSFSGTATAKLGCWMEYKVVSQSVENNTSTIRFYTFIANVAASGGYHIYSNNYDQTNRVSMTVKANGLTVYTRQKRGFATDLIPTTSDYTTQYQTPYRQSLIPLTEMQKLMGKDKFEEILGGLIFKAPDKPTLVPKSDKRPAINVTNAINEFNEI